MLPWVQVKGLASSLLRLTARRLVDDWQTRYAYRPVLVETFVQHVRYAGTAYRAANWACLPRVMNAMTIVKQYSINGDLGRPRLREEATRS